MSATPKYMPHYTVEDYLQWDGDWELIDGVAIAMTPSPFGPHERIVSRLARLLGNSIERCGCPCEVYTNLDWIVGHDTVVRPDLMVVCGEQPQRHLERAPNLVAEVLSESTRPRDLTAKRELYREHGVRRYVIIDPDTRAVEHIVGERTATASSEGWLHIELDNGCHITVECARLFDPLP